MRIPSSYPGMDIPGERFEYRHASCNVANIDFEDPSHGVRNANPRQIVRFDLERCCCANDCYRTSDDTKTHQNAECDLGSFADVEIAKKNDGKGSTHEVGQEGEYCAIRQHGCGRRIILKALPPWTMVIFITISLEKQVPGTPRSHTLRTGLHCRTIIRNRTRCVTTRKPIKDHSTRRSLLNWDSRSKKRHIEILQVANAMKNWAVSR